NCHSTGTADAMARRVSASVAGLKGDSGASFCAILAARIRATIVRLTNKRPSASRGTGLPFREGVREGVRVAGPPRAAHGRVESWVYVRAARSARRCKGHRRTEDLPCSHPAPTAQTHGTSRTARVYRKRRLRISRNG